jgi:molybdopterin converting factor small subunit
LNVKVRLHATLRKITPEGPQNRLTVDLPDNATVADLLQALEVEASPDHVMALIGNRRVEPDHPLNGSDEVQLFPPISGG